MGLKASGEHKIDFFFFFFLRLGHNLGAFKLGHEVAWREGQGPQEPRGALLGVKKKIRLVNGVGSGFGERVTSRVRGIKKTDLLPFLP